jgi:hypothetical protein
MEAAWWTMRNGLLGGLADNLYGLILPSGSTARTLLRVIGDLPGLIVADGTLTSAGKATPYRRTSARKMASDDSQFNLAWIDHSFGRGGTFKRAFCSNHRGALRRLSEGCGT